MPVSRLLSACLAPALLLPATRANDDVELKNDSFGSGGSASVQAGFAAQDVGAVVLAAAQPSDYPITLKRLQVLVLKHPILGGATLTGRFRVWSTTTFSGANPAKASAIFTSGSFAVPADTLFELDVASQNIVLNGPFTLGWEVLSTNVNFGGIHLPNLASDSGSGCQSGLNWVYDAPSDSWLNLCSAGGTGDLVIRAFVDTNRNVGQFIDLGNGLAGTFAPTLAGSGSLAGGGSFDIALAGAPPSATGPLFVGLSQLGAPFKGGVLVPLPDFTITIGVDGLGALVLSGGMPAGMPSNVALFLQAWFPDAGGAAGADATNGLELLTP